FGHLTRATRDANDKSAILSLNEGTPRSSLPLLNPVKHISATHTAYSLPLSQSSKIVEAWPHSTIVTPPSELPSPSNSRASSRSYLLCFHLRHNHTIEAFCKPGRPPQSKRRTPIASIIATQPSLAEQDDWTRVAVVSTPRGFATSRSRRPVCLPFHPGILAAHPPGSTHNPWRSSPPQSRWKRESGRGHEKRGVILSDQNPGAGFNAHISSLTVGLSKDKKFTVGEGGRRAQVIQRTGG
ncbi:hypothetical protein BKA70DRAFT_1570696, partial [Coprinopsis sp. MPI-PUGE-AT-0042]